MEKGRTGFAPDRNYKRYCYSKYYIRIQGSQFISNAARTYFAIKNQNTFYYQAATAMERMSRALRDAVSIRGHCCSPGKIRIQRTHATPQDPNQYVTFALNGSNLQRGSNTIDADPATYYDLAANCALIYGNQQRQ